MFIVKFYTIQLVIFSGCLNYTYAMVDRSEKHPHHHHSLRTDRQFRPVVNSIIFLIAANLVAKGALGLGGYQAPAIPNNVQGSLFLTLNAPNTPQQVAHQYLPLWFPAQGQLAPSSTQAPRPITQTQIVNIGEPLYEEVEEIQNGKEGPYTQKLFINRYNSIEDPLEPASSDEIEVKTEPEVITTEVNTEETTTIDNDAGLPQNFTNTDEDLMEVARQRQAIPQTTSPTTTTTMRPTTTFNPVTEGAAPINGANASNETFPGYGYGPSNGYDSVSLTYGPPPSGNNTRPNITNTYGLPLAYGPYSGNIYNQDNLFDSYGLPLAYGNYGYNNINNNYGPPSSVYGPYIGNNITSIYGPPQNITTNNTVPGYLPAGNYGPSNGNENISIAYGPPAYQRPIYPKPFFSSPEDPYLNSYNQQYNHFYDNSQSYYSNMYKYSDIFKNFYNNYPSFYNNYLGK